MNTSVKWWHGTAREAHPSLRWKLWVAAGATATLWGMALYLAISSWMSREVEGGFIYLGYVGAAAAIYPFGCFRCVPEAIDGVPGKPGRTLTQRWSDLALLSVFVATAIIGLSNVRVVWVNWQYVALWQAVVFVGGPAWLLMGTGAAAEKWLGWTTPAGEIRVDNGWRDRARGAIRWTGGSLGKWLEGKRGLGIGGGLALLSSVLFVRQDVFGPSYKGYEIVAGTGSWFFTDSTGIEATASSTAAMQIFRIAYAMGLVIAALALFGALTGSPGRFIRSSRSLCFAAGAIALFELTEMAGQAPGLGDENSPLAFGLLMLVWAVSMAIWGGFAGGNDERSEHNRMAVMVYYIPIFLLAFAFLPFYAYLAYGFGMFIAGMLIVWWGFLTSRRYALADYALAN